MHMDFIRLRVLRLSTLALTAFLGYEGAFFYWKGRLLGKVYAPNALPPTEDFLVGLADGRVIQYPFWAQTWMGWGLEPTMFPPLFAFVALLGLGALFFMWRLRLMTAWVLLVPFNLLAILHWGMGSALALIGLAALFWPGWRSFWFHWVPYREES